MESFKRGIEGEEVAEKYLLNLGYQILERNFHSSQGEIDIIAKDRDCLVFVEVKNYSYRSFGSPVGAVGKTKKKSIIHAAEFYLYKNKITDVYSRFDVVTIYTRYSGLKKIEHFKNAFYIK